MSRWLTQLRLAFRSVFRRKRVDQELDEELQYHLERQIDEGLNTGLAPEEARYAALRAMGAIAKNKEESRDMRRVNFIDDLFTRSSVCVSVSAPESRLCRARRADYGARHRRQYGCFQRGERSIAEASVVQRTGSDCDSLGFFCGGRRNGRALDKADLTPRLS